MRKLVVCYGSEADTYKVGINNVVSIDIDELDKEWFIVTFEKGYPVHVNKQYVIEYM